MAKKSVVWTQTAIKQRREILKYWTLRNKSTVYAEKLIGLIREQVDLIAKNPQAGKHTSHTGTRESAMGNFSIYYKLQRNKIFITAFWDNRQNPKKLLKIIKE
ncbi:MAG: type II toxin-antitoxin system RelE/ParE family toxin [Flavobacterium sp.]|nr:MAG: type II toxin-antitoxin system RelE/ParE family toxin [Flavobacterium sp.]